MRLYSSSAGFRLGPEPRDVAVVLRLDDGGELLQPGGHRTGEPVDRRRLAAQLLERLRVGGRDRRGLEGAEATEHLPAAAERVLHAVLLVQHHAHHECKRVFVKNLVSGWFARDLETRRMFSRMGDWRVWRSSLGTGIAIALLALTACTSSSESTSDASPTSSATVTSSKPSPKPSSSKPDPFANLSQAELDERLIAAAWVNDVARAKRLIAAGANVNAKDSTEQSAYLISTSEGFLKLLELTLRNGANIASLDSFNGTGLIRAAERGHHDVVGRLAQTPIKVNHVNNLGWTALHEAIILGNGSQRYVDTVRVLLAAGADPTIRSQRDGVLPLERELRGLHRYRAHAGGHLV